MLSDFQLLSDKISELAALAQALRRENAELRRNAAALALEKEELVQRMQQAHQRVAALMEKIPALDVDKEAV